jgi:hypothetical protein
VIESSGPLVKFGDEVVVFAGAIIRSVGGSSRPGFTCSEYTIRSIEKLALVVAEGPEGDTNVRVHGLRAPSRSDVRQSD